MSSDPSPPSSRCKHGLFLPANDPDEIHVRLKHSIRISNTILLSVCKFRDKCTRAGFPPLRVQEMFRTLSASRGIPLITNAVCGDSYMQEVIRHPIWYVVRVLFVWCCDRVRVRVWVGNVRTVSPTVVEASSSTTQHHCDDTTILGLAESLKVYRFSCSQLAFTVLGEMLPA